MGAEVEIKTMSADGKVESEEVKTKSPKKQKRHRTRKRHHFNSIRSQMEFYFGDANLSKDRFLKQVITKDPYVPLETFLTFNKMKALTSSVEEIAKSISNSLLLELDETQQKVRRKTALPADRNVDEKTLYVESLPSTADHDWVRQTFERFGPITYVSLPKYAKSRKIKEFGFVEFEQEASVEKAVKAFKEFNGVLSMEETDPGELSSVKSFIKEQNNEEDVKEAADSKKKKKRKNIKEEVENEGQPKAKKARIEDENSTTAAVDDEDSTASETADETANEDKKSQEEEEGEESAVGKKKRRKKKKKSKSVEQRKKDVELNTDGGVYYEMKILPKRDWKRLRNKYLNLQREKISELKRNAWKEQQQAREAAGESVDPAAAATLTPSKKSKPNERKLHRMNMNFYGAGEDEPQTKYSKEIKHNPALERAPLFTFEPRLIVEVGFMEPCVNVKEFKADMRQYAEVKYVDLKEGSIHSHLRLESAAAAEDFVRKVSCAEYNCKVLTGEAETEYWKKIEHDREMKLNKQVKVPQKRGRENVKKLITKHIRFGDDDVE